MAKRHSNQRMDRMEVLAVEHTSQTTGNKELYAQSVGCVGESMPFSCTQRDCIPGVPILATHHVTIISLEIIILCNKLNTVWDNGKLLTYILLCQYKII